MALLTSDGAQGFVAAFRRTADLDPQRVFARHLGSDVTFGWLDQASANLGSWLAGTCPTGARVLVMARNSPEVVAAFFAVARTGRIWVPINVQQRGAVLRHIVENAAPALILVDPDLKAQLAESGANVAGIPIVETGAGARCLSAMLEIAGTPDDKHCGPEDDVAINYTSGTSGPPKGVLLSHRMLRLAADAVVEAADLGDGDVLFHWEPLYHIGGLQTLLLPLIVRCELAMVERFSASRFWRQVSETQSTHIHQLGGILQILLKQPVSDDDRAHKVRIAWGGGCPEAIWRPFEERFGVAIRECYGMTEAASITTMNKTGEPGFVGHPVPWFEVTIRDEAGQILDIGQRGEICVASRIEGGLFRGYYKDEAATAKALRDGVLHTGDIGEFSPNGMLRFFGRANDSIRVKGENISAWEIESVVVDHDAIKDCAVIGVASDVGEQDIKLFVELKPSRDLEAEALWTWLSDKLPPYKMPRYIDHVTMFERTPSERIMKHKLSKMLDDCWDRKAANGAG